MEKKLKFGEDRNLTLVKWMLKEKKQKIYYPFTLGYCANIRCIKAHKGFSNMLDEVNANIISFISAESNHSRPK